MLRRTGRPAKRQTKELQPFRTEPNSGRCRMQGPGKVEEGRLASGHWERLEQLPARSVLASRPLGHSTRRTLVSAQRQGPTSPRTEPMPRCVSQSSDRKAGIILEAVAGVPKSKNIGCL